MFCHKCVMLRYLRPPTVWSTNRRCYASPGIMSAWQIQRYDDNEQLVFNDNVPVPTIRQPWDVLVKIHAASVNPIDTMMIGGYGSVTLNVLRRITCSLNKGSEFPLTLGRDFSGEVVATGKAVPHSHFKPGDQVWGAGDPWRQGTFREYTTINALQISHKPKILEHIEAASMPYVGATCWASLCIFGWIKPNSLMGKNVLVIGGSGGVGTFAIQLLKAWGGRVWTTCSTDSVVPLLELGADIAIDYTTQNAFTELQLSQGQGFDLIFDAAGDHKDECVPLLRKYHNSRYITLTTPFLQNNDKIGFPFGLVKTGLTLGAENYKRLQDGQTYRWGLFVPNGYALKQIASLVDQHKIRPVVEKVYNFQDLKEAFDKVKAKHNRGKTVLNIAGEQSQTSSDGPSP